MIFLFCFVGVSSPPGCLGKAALSCLGTPWANEPHHEETIMHMRKQRRRSASVTEYEWHHEETVMHMRKQRRRSALVTAKLISTFVFATWIIRFLYFLDPEFQTSSHLLWQYSPVLIRSGQKPECWFSHDAAHITIMAVLY